eukprot:TRINITY_DN21735_c0_g1_i1.p1 TRINITY_DN21735_c0_g1~~TRINITY_DN21735_c0_g1_i1.p1  ORF type:complete len:913 (-),score=280.20 TRINITY_DN21735_c0_g1_i1:52-2631(-)
MTVGKDVSTLFTDVVNCMQTDNLELKKLVYLYVMNYAKSQPDLAILAVNTFVKDAGGTKPLVRALAVRTMGCIRVDKITEYLCQPLRKCLQDEDPYVRKTSAVCVAKLYDINPELVVDRGFIDVLREMLSDPNPMVVANAVSALTEIAETSGDPSIFSITPTIQNKLLAALNECSEWGQVFILDAFSFYTPADGREAESICERISPRLQHANSAVVLSTVKVLLRYLDLISNQDFVRGMLKKMAPPLVTLMSSNEPEIQYVALRNIDLIVQKRPQILAHEVKIFFCKYNDPIYVKLEKLEILIKIVSDKNVEQVLPEFKEYATEVDVDFVRKAVRAIGRTAIKLSVAAERCIRVLLDLIQTKVNYVVQEAIVVIKDIFRRYPNQYESIISVLCENLDSLDEPEAKAAMIWIIGEYADRIDNAAELLDLFLENFQEENTQVQLQLLTATVKLFLKKPDSTQAMVQKVLGLATNDSDNPDLRDRGYIYWRLLSTDPDAARAVVLAEKPLISDDTNTIAPSLLDDLLKHIATLSSVYHKLPETFVSKTRAAVLRAQTMVAPTLTDDAEDGGADGAAKPAAQPQTIADLLDLGGDVLGGQSASASTTVTVSQQPAANLAGLEDDFFNMSMPSQPAGPPPKPIVLDAQRGNGLQIAAQFARKSGQITLELTFTNQTPMPLTGFAIQFNKNTFGLQPGTLNVPAPLPPRQSVDATVPIAVAIPPPGTPNADIVQMAIKTSAGVVYFQVPVPFNVVLTENGRVDRNQFLQLWKMVPETDERTTILQNIFVTGDQAQQKLEQHNIFFIAKRNVSGVDILYLSSKTVNNNTMLLELTIGSGQAKLSTRCTQLDYVPWSDAAVERLLRA